MNSIYAKDSKNKVKTVERIFGIKDEQNNDKLLPLKPKRAHMSAPTKKARISKHSPTKKPKSAPARILTNDPPKKISPSRSMLYRLPDDVKGYIIDRYTDMLPFGYKLRDWIPINLILWRPLCENPNALTMIEERIEFDKTLSEDEYRERYLNNNDERLMPPGEYNTVHWGTLSINKNAIDLIKKKMEEEEHLTIDEYNRLRENDRLDWAAIGLNSNPNAMYLLNKKRSAIEWFTLSSQKNAMSLFIKDKFKAEKLIMATNPDILFSMHGTQKLDWRMLSSNTAAIELIKEHLLFEKSIPLDTYNYTDSANKIDWWELAKNPKAMPIIIKFIEDYIRYESVYDDESNPISRYTQHLDPGLWRGLSENPSATEYLYNNYRDRIQWQAFSANTSKEAIKYLQERIEIEKNLDLNHPNNYNKIDWGKLSSNPSAFELLDNNIDKIHWDKLCCNTNPKVMKLIERKFREEPDVFSDEWGLLRPHQKLYWYGLSKNPAIFSKKIGKE